MWLQSLLYVSCVLDTLKGLESAQGLYRPLGKAQRMNVHISVKLMLSVETSALALMLVTLPLCNSFCCLTTQRRG